MYLEYHAADPRTAWRHHARLPMTALSLAVTHADVTEEEAPASTGAASRGVDVRLIDFAHVFAVKDGERDENTLAGVNNVINCFRCLLDSK